MPDLHLETLPDEQRRLLEKLRASFETPDRLGFYLAGGTALALQVGHRQSLDFDFFSQQAGVGELISDWLGQFQNLILRETDADTVHAEIAGVKTSFIGHYKYPLLSEAVTVEKLRLAGLLDIGLMKLLAIIHRATLRDYLDLAVILRDHLPLSKLLEASVQKYGGHFNAMIPLRALVSFEDVDLEKPVILDKKLESSWQTILTQAVKEAAQ